MRLKEVTTKSLFMGKMPSVGQKVDSHSRSKSPTEEEMMIELSNLKILHFPTYNIDYFISCFGRVPILYKLLRDADQEKGEELDQVRSAYLALLMKIKDILIVDDLLKADIDFHLYEISEYLMLKLYKLIWNKQSLSILNLELENWLEVLRRHEYTKILEIPEILIDN